MHVLCVVLFVYYILCGIMFDEIRDNKANFELKYVRRIKKSEPCMQKWHNSEEILKNLGSVIRNQPNLWSVKPIMSLKCRVTFEIHLSASWTIPSVGGYTAGTILRPASSQLSWQCSRSPLQSSSCWGHPSFPAGKWIYSTLST